MQIESNLSTKAFFGDVKGWSGCRLGSFAHGWENLHKGTAVSHIYWLLCMCAFMYVCKCDLKFTYFRMNVCMYVCMYVWQRTSRS